MIHTTKVDLDINEITTLLILCQERLELEKQGRVKHMIQTTREIWLKYTASVLEKMSKAYDHCIVTNPEPMLFSQKPTE